MSVVVVVLLMLLSAHLVAADPENMMSEFEVPENSPSLCQETTKNEGNYTYCVKEATACCTIGGMADFDERDPVFKLKSDETPVSPICCLTPGSTCLSSAIHCCNNNKCINNTCTDESPNSEHVVSLSLEADSCLDQNKPYHVTVRVSEYSGDVCCNTDKIHMIKYDEHCCSTSNAPFLTDHPYLTPKCCGPQLAMVQFQQYSNTPTVGHVIATRPKDGITFCRDNLSGAYNVSKDLSAKRMFYGNPLVVWKGHSEHLQCCKNTSKKYAIHDVLHFYDRGCCEKLTDRFQEEEVQMQKCCVFSGKCHTGFPCCSGQCIFIGDEKILSDDPSEDYACGWDKDHLAKIDTVTCGKESMLTIYHPRLFAWL
jgi:hypothetical protein